MRPIAALRARVRLAQGQLDEALRWAREQHPSADDELSYVREFDHITLAHVLMADNLQDWDGRSLADAVRLLHRLLTAAEEGGRAGRVIEILTLQAAVHEARGERSAALTALERAVTLAEPEGYVRLFVEQGGALPPLLRALTRRPTAPRYAHRLLAATTTQPVGREPQPLVDPLSVRELDVLRLLASELDGPDIARQMVVSLNTVRTHTKSIYAKLGVNSRRAAVRRAEELDLLSRTAGA